MPFASNKCKAAGLVSGKEAKMAIEALLKGQHTDKILFLYLIGCSNNLLAGASINASTNLVLRPWPSPLLISACDAVLSALSKNIDKVCSRLVILPPKPRAAGNVHADPSEDWIYLHACMHGRAVIGMTCNWLIIPFPKPRTAGNVHADPSGANMCVHSMHCMCGCILKVCGKLVT
eukprot:scaffold187173_cov19-Tisochrysis_lutea.AAC.5